MTISMPPDSPTALTKVAEMLESALKQHVRASGPPPGEYEQGFVDGYNMAIAVVIAAAGNAARQNLRDD